MRPSFSTRELLLGLLSPLLAAGQSCQTTTLQTTVPSNNSVALRDYSYCGGTLNATAFIQNTAYNKLVSLYYTNKQNQSTPLTAAQLGYRGDAANATGWELWGTSTQIYIDGISELLNITFQDTDNRKTYVEQLHVSVTPSGAPAPSPPGPPKPYASPKNLADDITQFLAPRRDSQIGASHKKMFTNISPNIQGAKPGSVVAARSGPYYTAKDPDYAYNWVRDSSLTYDVVYDLYAAATDRKAQKQYETLFFDYAVGRATEQIDPNLQTGLGEPKFYLNQTIFRGPWGRPQNDGPATASIALIEFAKAYLKKGGSLKEVKEKIYDSDKFPKVAPVKKDLLFVASNWTFSTFDIWEEVQSTQFYNAMVYRRALIMGSDFADQMGDASTVRTLRAQVAAVTKSLEIFWEPNRGILLYEYGPVLRDKSSYLDTAVILGLIHGYNNDGVYSFSNERVLSTALHLVNSFSIYGVSKRQKDNAGRTIATPIGRYPEDIYNGTGTQENGGNPWYLCTASVAQMFYKASTEFSAAGSVSVTKVSQPFFDYFTPDAKVKAGSKYSSKSREFKDVIAGLNGWADAFMRTIKTYTPKDQTLAEEFNRDSGAPQGAVDLTWSYASVLTAAFARAELTGDKQYVSKVANFGIDSNSGAPSPPPYYGGPPPY